MKKSICLALTLSALLGGQAFANEGEMLSYKNEKKLYKSLSISKELLKEVKSYGVIHGFSLDDKKKRGAGTIKNNSVAGEKSLGLTNYEADISLSAESEISEFERHILSAYLSNPGDVKLAKYLSFHHLNSSLLAKNAKHDKGQALKHSILAQYFINRVLDLGSEENWAAMALEKNSVAIKKVMKRKPGADSSEGYEPQKNFLETFNYKEENRNEAYRRLLAHHVEKPNNAITSFYIMALNFWNGGEVDYDDPTVLYHYIVGAYFSYHTIELAKIMENDWLEDSDKNVRLRLSSILGGFSIPMRRWMSNLHGDTAAVKVLDEEHEKWRVINPRFHLFTVGNVFFDEKDNFEKGLFAWRDGFRSCDENAPKIQYRICKDQPRFSFNRLSVILGAIDYEIKAGNLGRAKGLLTIRQSPIFHFDEWTLGKESWLHRENNFQAIADLYANDNPDDDPQQYFMKKRQWGDDTQTCQSCHQAQARKWTEEQKSHAAYEDYDVLTIGDWPTLSTTWYGRNLDDGKTQASLNK